MSQLNLTARGVRNAMWDAINDAALATNRIWWTEAELLAVTVARGATERQALNALLKYLDWGELICSPDKDENGKWVPCYRIKGAN